MMGRGGMPRQGPPPGYAASGPGGFDPYGNVRAAPPPQQQMPDPGTEAAMHHDEFVAGPMLPIGQAIEMDERTGSPSGPISPQGPPRGYPQQADNGYGLRDSDGDVAGMVGLQQGRAQQPPMTRLKSDGSEVRSVTSEYSDQ